MKLTDLNGCNITIANSLEKAGYKTIELFLKGAATDGMRQSISEETGIDVDTLTAMAMEADFFRVKGVQSCNLTLLTLSGITSLEKLSKSNASYLHGEMEKKNEGIRIVRRMPGLKEVRSWISQAGQLPKVFEL